MGTDGPKSSSIEPHAPGADLGARLESVAGVIRGGGVVAFPTETFYGLGADPHQPEALRRVLGLKGRDAADKPLLLIAASLEQVAEWVRDLPPVFDRLAAHFWPGPLTMVLPAREGLPAPLLGPGGGVALRISGHTVARALCRACGTAITGTSANPTATPPCADAAAVEQTFVDGLDAILDAGPTSGGEASTIVDLCAAEPRLIRAGATEPDALRAIIGLV